MGRGRSFRDYDPSASRGDPPHCSYTEQWVQFSPILNQRSVEQWPVWINYCAALLKMSEDWRGTFDNREVTFVVVVNFSKAFDSAINHTLLLAD